MGPEPEDEQYAEGEKNSSLEVRQSECVPEGVQHLDHLSLPTRGFNLALCLRAESMRSDGQRFVDIAASENLHVRIACMHQPGLVQLRKTNYLACFETSGYRFKIDYLEGRRKTGIVETPFRNPSRDRHLAAFETRAHASAAPCFLTFVTLSGCLSGPASDSLTKAFSLFP